MISLMCKGKRAVYAKCTSLLYTVRGLEQDPDIGSVRQHVVTSFSHYEEPVSINQARLSIEKSGKKKSFRLLRCEDVRSQQDSVLTAVAYTLQLPTWLLHKSFTGSHLI